MKSGISVGLLLGLFAVTMMTSTVLPFVSISFAEEQDNEQDEEKENREQQREGSRDEARQQARDDEVSGNADDENQHEDETTEDDSVEERTRQAEQEREQARQQSEVQDTTTNNAIEDDTSNEQPQKEEVDKDVALGDETDPQRRSISEAPQPTSEPQPESLQDAAPLAVEQQAEPPKSALDIQLERIGQEFARNLDPNSPGNQALFGTLINVADDVAQKADLGNVPIKTLQYAVAARLALPVLSQLDTANTLLSNAEAIEKVNAQLERTLLQFRIAPGVIPPLTPVPTACPPGQTGTPPNCVPTSPEQCPPGQTGTPPNCTPTTPPPTDEPTQFDDSSPEARELSCSSVTDSFDNQHCNTILSESNSCSPLRSPCDIYIINGGGNKPSFFEENDEEFAGGGNGQYYFACKEGFEPVHTRDIVVTDAAGTRTTPVYDCM